MIHLTTSCISGTSFTGFAIGLSGTFFVDFAIGCSCSIQSCYVHGAVTVESNYCDDLHYFTIDVVCLGGKDIFNDFGVLCKVYKNTELYTDIKMEECRVLNDTEYPDSRCFVDYLYVEDSRLDVNFKTRVLYNEPKTLEDLPLSRCSLRDGNTGTDISSYSELILKPVALYPDPFRKGKHKMALCEVMKDLTTPAVINTRQKLVEDIHLTVKEEPWFGIEQEFLFQELNREMQANKGVTSEEFLDKVGKLPNTYKERCIVEKHASACVFAGLHLYGMNREYMASQWEYQLGPTDPLTLADNIVVSRYLLTRIAEMYEIGVTFAPKESYFSHTSSLQLSFSTRVMREANGIEKIHQALQKLSNIPQDQLLRHFDRNGGKDNAVRLTGKRHLPTEEFTVGFGQKTSSIRIPLEVMLKGQGYFEERRPSSDCDPYSLIRVYLEAVL